MRICFIQKCSRTIFFPPAARISLKSKAAGPALMRPDRIFLRFFPSAPRRSKVGYATTWSTHCGQGRSSSICPKLYELAFHPRPGIPLHDSLRTQASAEALSGWTPTKISWNLRKRGGGNIKGWQRSSKLAWPVSDSCRPSRWRGELRHATRTRGEIFLASATCQYKPNYAKT